MKNKEKEELILKSYKIRLIPTEEQNNKFFHFAGCSRYVYNWCLGFQKERYENGESFVSDRGMSKYLTALKKDGKHDWLYDVDSVALVQAYTDACRAYKNFFNGLKKKQKVGFPKFKAKYKTKPSFASNIQGIKILDGYVQYPKIGKVKAIRTDYIPKDIKFCSARTTFDGLYWYLSISTSKEYDLKGIKPHNDLVLGVDLGIKDLAIISDGEKYKKIGKIENIKRTKKRLKKLQRQVSRKYRINGCTKKNKTNNIVKLEREINKLHKRITNISQNYRHNLTSDIIKKNPSKVVIEDLNVKGMMKNKHLAEDIGAAGWYEIRRQLEYKCKYNNIELIVADRWYPSSKMCSTEGCDYINKDLKLKDRKWTCPKCGAIHDRDLNAAINLMKYEENIKSNNKH